ncbi:unnamed protein product [Protopolystoma xenopodis]|uniref:Uncharacterized protein n=1 Tax=Protopolystoma xenopodis TaxID=117903 RepID=A0A448XPT5_9PLAT|nr:unnamed protein product [Protopolystoma xenopodis]
MPAREGERSRVLREKTERQAVAATATAAAIVSIPAVIDLACPNSVVCEGTPGQPADQLSAGRLARGKTAAR